MFKTNHYKSLNKLVSNTLKIQTQNINLNLNLNLKKFQVYNFSEQQQQHEQELNSNKNNSNNNNNLSASSENQNSSRDLLLLSKQEKVYSKVLLRNIRFYANNSNNNNNNNNKQNPLYDSVSNKLINTFNFSEENQDLQAAASAASSIEKDYEHSNIINQHYLLDENDSESNLIYSTHKSFYVDWTNSNFTQGKFALRIKSQSKNIIFEDLFNSLQNIKDENSLFVVNFDSQGAEGQNSAFSSKTQDTAADEHDLLSDSEDALNRSRHLLDFPKDSLEESAKDRRKFDLHFNYDSSKPNQLLFFCEKLFVNEIISAEELSEIKRLAFISNRNLKYTQDQSLNGNQYESSAEALADIRVLQRLERLQESTDIKAVFDLNLLFSRSDHKLDAKVKMPKGAENLLVYVISDKDNLEFLSKVPGISKLDSGEFFEEFVNMIDKDSYNKKFKLFIAKNNLEIITQKAEVYERFEEKSPGFQNHIRNNEEEIISEVTDVLENKINVRLGKDNRIEANIGDLTLGDESLLENFAFLKKQILKLKPQTVSKKNYIKNVSLFVNNVEFRLKNKE